jgi:hypothetical protein
MNGKLKEAVNAGVVTAVLAQAAAGLIDTAPAEEKVVIVPTRLDPWHFVQFTKSERRGKTFAEIDDLRRQRWEAAHPQPSEPAPVTAESIAAEVAFKPLEETPE